MRISHRGAQFVFWTFVVVIAATLMVWIWSSQEYRKVRVPIENRVENAVHMPNLEYEKAVFGWLADFDEFRRAISKDETVYTTVRHFSSNRYVQKIYLARASNSPLMLGYKENYKSEQGQGWTVKSYSDKEAVFSYSNTLILGIWTLLVLLLGGFLSVVGSGAIYECYKEKAQKVDSGKTSSQKVDSGKTSSW